MSLVKCDKGLINYMNTNLYDTSFHGIPVRARSLLVHLVPTHTLVVEEIN